jgi:predicted transposase YdaD
LEAIYEANPEKVEERFKMSDTALTLEKVLENIGLTARWEERGIKRDEKRGEEKKAFEIAGNFLKMGLSAEQIAEASGLPVEKVRALSRP